MVDEEHTVSFKKGDNSWKQISQLSSIEECFNMVYKDHMLYFLNYSKLKIFDFSGESPHKFFKISVRGCIQIASGYCMRLLGIPWEVQLAHYKNNMVVTVGGDLLIVDCERPSTSNIWNFEIYKMDSAKGNKWEKIVYLGNEAILLDLGITVIAKDIEGIKRNAIYFNGSDLEDQNVEKMFSYSIPIQKRLNNRTTLFFRPFHAIMRDGSYQVPNEND